MGAMGYVALAIVGAFAVAGIRAFTQFAARLVERKIGHDDETRIRTIRMEERFGSDARTPTRGPAAHAEYLELLKQILQGQQSQASTLSSLTSELAGVNGRLTESLRLNEQRLSRVERELETRAMASASRRGG